MSYYIVIAVMIVVAVAAILAIVSFLGYSPFGKKEWVTYRKLNGQVVTKWRRRKLIERTKENDIRYRGFISHRGLRVMGWISIAIAQVSVIIALAIKVIKNIDPAPLKTASEFFDFFGSFGIPLMLLANFAFIMNRKKGFKRILLLYGGLAILLYLIGVFVSSHYIFGYANKIFGYGYWEFSLDFSTYMVLSGKNASYIFNIFIDLFLCSLTFFFLNYKPKKYFQGKKIYIFRFMVLIPILYELGSILIKYFIHTEGIAIHLVVFFLLTAKPPFMFVAFVLIALVMKIQDVRYLRQHDYDENLLNEYYDTNAHSLKVSITIVWVFILCSLLDVIVILLFGYGYGAAHNDVDLETAIAYGIFAGSGAGFGNASTLLLVTPIVFLFSYSKEPKNRILDLIVPLFGILLIAIVYIEGLFQISSNKIGDFMDALLAFVGME